MKPAYLVGGLLAVVFLAIAAYYALPAFSPHILTSDVAGHPAHHYKHAALFGGLAVLSLVGAWFVGNSSSAKPAA